MKIFNVKPLALIMSIFVMMIQFGCKSGGKNEANDEFSGISEAHVDSIIQIVYSLPDPDEILDELLLDTLVLQPGLTNPIQNSNKYLLSKAVALNVGVYTADMAYLIIEENNLKALDYFRTILQMTKSLNLGNPFREDLMQQVEDNIGNQDALIQLFRESMDDLKDQLEYSEQKKALALLHTGAIVETLYLVFSNMECDVNNVFMEKIYEQRYLIENLIDFLSEFSGDEDIQPTLKQMEELHKQFGVESGAEEVTVETTGSNKLIIGSKNQKPEKVDLDLIKAKISMLRAEITKI